MKTLVQKGIVIIKKGATTLLFDPKTITLFQPYKNKSLSNAIEEYCSLPQKIQKIPITNQSLTVFLLVSNDCNLRCDYCYAHGGNYGNKRGQMDEKTLKKALFFLKKNFPKVERFVFSFFGGEPFLFPDLMKKAFALIKEMLPDKKVFLGGSTNGTILPNFFLSSLKKYKFGAQISLDGIKKKHDLHRKRANQEGSYDLIKKNLSKFQSIDQKLRLHTTLAPDNLNLLENYAHAKKLGATLLYFSLAETDSCPSLSFTSHDVKTLKKSYTKLAEIYLKDLLQGRSVRIGNFISYMKILYCKRRKNFFCGVGSGSLAISHSGDIFPCHRFVSEKKYCIGNVFSDFNKKSFNLLKTKLHIDRQKKCKECFLRYLCGGGCYHEETMMLKKNIVVQNGVPCEMYRHIALLSFWLYAELLKAGVNLKKILFSKTSA